MSQRFNLILKRIFIVIIFTTIYGSSYASHVQGGEITMRCLGGNQYEIRLALYRDCAGVNAPNSVSINYKSTSCGQNKYVTLNKIPNTGIEVSPLCPSATSRCNGGSLPGVQEYIYTAIVTLTACNDWVFSYAINARNSAISTISNPGSQSMYIESKLNNLNYPCNNSPTFTNKPVPFICVGQQYCFNNGANDADGDSLSYQMVIPATSATNNVTYITPYSAAQPLASTPPVTLNPLTGDICMTPTQLQVTVFAVLVTEWRNGVPIGQIRRDIQIRTITCNNSNPSLNGINNTGVYTLKACVGNPISFTIPSFDNDLGDNLTLTWNNGIPGGTFNPGTGSRPTGTFTWNPTISNVSATPYCFTVTVADNNCPIIGTQSYSFCITVGGFTTTTTHTDVICTNTNGTASVTAANSPSSFTYLWSPGGQTTSAVTGLAAGTYTVTTSDSIGCSVVDTIVINSTSSATASITSFTNPLCNGANNGSITAALTGQNLLAPLTYTWSPAVAGNVNTANNLGIGTYTVIITDSQGCTDTVTQVITQPALLNVNTNFVNVGCFGGSSGSASANASGGTPGYSYLWMPGAYNTSSISSLPIGTYTVTVTDTNGCNTNKSITIVEPTPLNISSTVVNANCGLSDGSASVVGSGGFPPYTWAWSNSQMGPNATNLAAGTYTVTITDANFCTKTISVSVGNNAGPTVQISSLNNVTCNGDNNGNITVVITGGSSPYTYLWNNGQITPTASNLAPGLYSVIITDANGCSATIDTIITEPTPLTNNFIQTNPICFGGNTGSVSANPLGGTPPYSYLWSMPGNPTTQTVTNLTAGTYSVTITDANGCTITQTVTLTNPPTVNTVITPFHVNCFSACDGMAATTITNGVPPYTYSWNDPLTQTTDTAKFLCAGNYQVNIIDGNGCTSQASVVINEPTQLTTTISSKGDLLCYQNCIGFAQVTATGGTAPYSYSWSNSSTTSTATNLCAGSYSCTVTDAKGCTSIITVIITQPTKLTATISGTDIKCFNQCDGTGNISFSGGTAPYSFLWTPGLQTVNNPNDLCPGQNIAKITDANGCNISDTITLIQSLPILLNALVTNVSNCGQPNGSACVTPSGGLPPYTYIWNNPAVSTTPCITNMVAGTYTVDVMDSAGCIKTEVLNINDIQAPTATVVSHTDLLCHGDTNGSAITNITGGAPPYTILWTAGNQTVQNPTNLIGGTHTMTVTDTANCVSSVSVTILEPSDINSTILSSTNVTCFGLCDGNAVASATGGTGALSFLWNDPSTQATAAANNLCAGNYTVTIKDANNCTKTNSVIITEPNELKIDSNSFENLKCFQDNTGSIYTSVSGGTPFYTYNWTPNISTSPVANSLPAGNYALQVVDQHGCTVDENWTISEPALLTGTPSQLDATCSFNNGNATVVVNGGTTPYSYNWNDPNLQTTPTATNLFAGTYTVVVTDTNNCSFTQTYIIIDEAGPVIDTITTTPVSCFGGNNGTASVILDPNTGTAPFSYAWNPSPQTLPNISGLSAGTYNVIVTDSNGCVASGNITVKEPPLLQLFSSLDDTICFGDTIMIYGQASGGIVPYSYTWIGASGLNQVGTNNVFPVGTTTYTVSVTDSNGCAAGPNNVTISVLPALNVIATDTFMCDGDSVLISAFASGGNGNPYIYSWNNGDTTQSQVVSPTLVSSPMNYIITINDGCSTPAYDTATVIVNPNPIIDSIITTDVLCYGDSTGTANVFVNAAFPAPITYDWGFISQLNPLLNGLKEGQYYVTIKDNNGCIVKDSIIIDQPDSLQLTVIGDSICFGATGQVSASTLGGIMPYTYSWTGITGSPTTGGPHSVAPATTTSYTVSVTDSNNCVVPPINVTVKVGPPLSVVATDDEVCEGKTANISATPSGGGAPYFYAWSNGANTQSQSVIINQTDTFFVVTLTDGCSTPATDTSFVKVNLNPTGSLLAFPKEGCIPLSVDFVASSNDGIKYYWDYGNNTSTSTTLDTVTYTYINSGNYDISLTIVNLKGCSTVVDSLNYIHAYPNPIADFQISPDPISIFDTEAQFTDLSYTNIVSWAWNFAGYGTSSIQHPSFTFPEIPQDYNISLKVTDNHGCVDSTIKILTIKPEWAFYVPTAFTPDLDNLNDGFSPNGFGISNNDYSFYVYNRWGQLIFETHNLFEPWNGTYKNKLVQQDTYVWRAYFRALDGTQNERMGRVTIIK